MLKRISKIAISMVLVIAICLTTCTSAFAAISQKKYISDIIVCQAANADEAKKELEKDGYKLLSNENISETLPDGMYFGYKTTLNPEEAITDISAMNMTGKYSFADYEVLLKNMKEDVAATVDGLIPMITAFRENYNAENPVAVEVHGILNKFLEDDSAKSLGDYLLTCDLADTTDLTKVFMQAYAPFVLDIQQLLFIAGENDSDKTWIEKMASSDPDSVVDLYMDSYPTPSKAFQALASDYGKAAEDFELTWDNLYEILQDTTDTYFSEKNGSVELNEKALTEQFNEAEENSKSEINNEMSDEEIIESIEKINESSKTFDSFGDAGLVDYLASLEYNDGTMLDFFMRPFDEVDEIELYTLAYYMGKDLTAQLSNVGLLQTLSRILVDGNSASADKFNEINKAFEKIEKISIYDGVDRSLFENGVALTGPSVEKFVSSGKNWSDDLFSRIFRPTDDFKWKDYFAFYVLPTVASTIVYASLFLVNHAMRKVIEKSCTEVAKNVVKGSLIYNDHGKKLAQDYIYNHMMGYFAYGKGLVARSSLAYRIVAGIRCAFFVLTIAMTVASIAMLIVTIFFSKESDVKYDAIPNHIVDTVSTEHGDDYVAYDFVKNTQGSAADLNNYKGKKGWLVLYYTKDQSAGAPITTDFKIVKNSENAPLDYDGISVFGEKNAANITSVDFTGVKDSVGGTYIYFSRGDISTVGSVFTNGYIAIALGVGACAGMIIGILTSKIRYNKKKKALA